MPSIDINQLPPIIRAAVKPVTRRKTAILLDHRYSPGQRVLTGWDGGSRSTWHWVLSNGRLGEVDLTSDPDRTGDPWGQRKIIGLPPAEAFALLEIGITAGKPSYPVITIIDRDLLEVQEGA